VDRRLGGAERNPTIPKFLLGYAIAAPNLQKSLILVVSNKVGTMLIPNAENAVVDIRKLRDYCLNPDHDEGKHKARLFSSILGMTAENAQELREIILEVVKTNEAKLGRCDGFGQRYTLDFPLEWHNRNATIRTGWIIEPESNIPRLTTCYPL
jgi:hypothetical protein